MSAERHDATLHGPFSPPIADLCWPRVARELFVSEVGDTRGLPLFGATRQSLAPRPCGMTLTDRRAVSSEKNGRLAIRYLDAVDQKRVIHMMRVHCAHEGSLS